MNLINDKWIPIRRKNRRKEKIAPWQITENYSEDPIIELAAVRPDFNGALIQFLIGLLQTTCSPNDTRTWRQWINNPPSPTELKTKFDTISHAFNLIGVGPRFMQDLTIEKETKKKQETVDKLLIDAAGTETIKKNTDLFIKRDRTQKLCLSCSAQALLTLQINAPSGGAGHRTGLRGGGPVSTIVSGNNLWETVWNNVLDESAFLNLASSVKTSDKDKFPWLEKTRTSEKGQITTNQDIHAAQIYWSMPRRIRLIINSSIGKCDLCCEQGNLVEEYFTKPYGVNYSGLIHPLTPTYKKDKEILSSHQHDTIGYKYWLGYVQSTPTGKDPARIINSAINRRLNKFRLWAFGYDMDNMKASCWYEGIMPVIIIDNEEKRKIFEVRTAQLIKASEYVVDKLKSAVKESFPKTKKNNPIIFNLIKHRFWQETEPEFYHQIQILREDIMKNGDGLSVHKEWHKYLALTATQIFNDISQAEMIERINPKRVADAYNNLMKVIYGKKIKKEILDLPEGNK